MLLMILLEVKALSNEDKINQLFWIMGIMIVVFVLLRPPIEYYRQYFAQWTPTKYYMIFVINFIPIFKS